MKLTDAWSCLRFNGLLATFLDGKYPDAMIDATQFKSRVQELAERDPQRCLFGGELHKYQFGECLSESEIDSLESAYSIKIPSEYRRFLASIGNGGAGPGYGLEQLRPPAVPEPPSRKTMGITLYDDDGNVVRRTEYEDVGVNYDPDGSNNTATANEPFPLTKPYRSITDEMWATQIPNWSDQLRSEHQSNKEEFRKIAFGHGVLKIAHYGSGIYATLVLNGPFRGQVWVTDPYMGDYVPASMRTDLHNSSVKPEHSYALHQEPFTFNSWYDHWLDSAMIGLEREYDH